MDAKDQRIAELEGALREQCRKTLQAERLLAESHGRCSALAAALKAEKARLDWLEQEGKPETYEDAPHALVWVVQGEPGARSIRDAIDAARLE